MSLSILVSNSEKISSANAVLLFSINYHSKQFITG